MANINNMQMAEAICKDNRIEVRNSFLGLVSKVVYRPTNSRMEVTTLEFAPASGEKLKALLGGPAEKLSKQLGSFKGQSTVNGNFKLEVCVSRDGAFAAIQLLRYMQLNYEPVTGVLLLEGDGAKAVLNLIA